MTACLWCDDPTVDGDKLCPLCRKVNDTPPFVCDKGLGHIPALWDRCAECHRIAESKRLRAEANAPRIAQLEAIRAQLIAEWHWPWPGIEFGKVILGKSIDGAIAELRRET